MMHAVIGSNILDRLIKCPGSLKPGSGSLKDYDEFRSKKRKKGTNHYKQNRIEDTDATRFGLKVDEMAKNLLRMHFGLDYKDNYVTDEDYIDTKIVSKAEDYSRHMLKLKERLGRGFIDPLYTMNGYIEDLEDVEFRVFFNPDFVAMNNDRSGLAYVSDLVTGTYSDRNKMFQVLCGAIGVIEHYPNITECACEVYNVTTQEVEISKFSREELEAWRDDIIKPGLAKVREALGTFKNDIEFYRNKCSWCERYCIFKDEGCCKCHSNESLAKNDVETQIIFNYTKMTTQDREDYANLFK